MESIDKNTQDYGMGRICGTLASGLSAEDRRVYERGMIFLLVRAVKELYPDREVKIRHSVHFDIYFEIIGESEILPAEIALIEERMRSLAEGNIPFIRQNSVNTIPEPTSPETFFYDFNGMTERSYGYLPPHSGCLTEISLIYRYPGAIMAMPRDREEKQRAEKYAAYQDVPRLLSVFAEYKNWGRILGIENIGELNNAVAKGDAPDIIRVAEALQEKKISQIADQITNAVERKKIVMIAGPSSSGKTTFANRLSIHLRVNGFMTKILSMDNYYLNREDAPVDKNGVSNLECPEALDLELFSEQMKALIAGDVIDVPLYDFRNGRRDKRTLQISLREKQILIVEGIHGLNPNVTAYIPKEYKHKIYISALTSLNIDDHNRIPTTDARLLRRIVRDNAFRGTKAAETIRMWQSVRAGEEEYIFPYQEHCDSMFNSGLIYELGAMKETARALLIEIEKDEDVYAEAVRLYNFLGFFSEIKANDIPLNSILREFIGGGCFNV